MERTIKSGSGWRIGWVPEAKDYPGLIGSSDWAFELTAAELNDFRRLLEQLVEMMNRMAEELVAEERIACEAESDLLWMEVEGYAHAYSLRIILNQGRRCEGNWTQEAVPQLVQAARSLEVF